MVVSAATTMYANKQKGNYEARVASNNSKVAEWQRQDALRQGAADASAVRAAGNQAGSSALAGVAANGIDTTTGSAGNLFAATAINTEADADTAKSNAARKAWLHQNEAKDLRSQAGMVRKATLLGNIGTGISTGAQAAAYTYSTKQGT